MKSRLNKYSNLRQRVIAGIIGAALIIGSILLGPWSYFGIFLLITMFSQLEFYKLVGLDGRLPLKYWGTVSGMMIFILTFFYESNQLNGAYLFLLFPFAAITYFIKLYKKSDIEPFVNIAFTFLGIIYVALPFALLNVIAFSQGTFHRELVLGIVMLLWSADVGAYFAGVQFGKTKLFERISPKKSWEGMVGGAVLTFLIATLLATNFPVLPSWKWLTVAGIIIITGTYGDLIESLFKRSMMIKDSGTAIPGHGGFMDRFDALFMSMPFVTAFLKMT